MKPLLMHMGSGALGLGLVVSEFARHTQADVYILNRESGDEESRRRNTILKANKYFYLRSVGFDTPVRFNDLIYFDDIDAIKKLAVQKRPVFFTTSIKEYGIEASLKLIADIIYARHNANTRHPLVFIACENAINSLQVKNRVLKNLQIRFGSEFAITDNIIFLNCVVDRLCNSPVITHDNVIVDAEGYGSWIIDRTTMRHMVQQDFILDTLSKCESVEIVDEIAFFVNRKKWIVNALHQMIALYAHVYKHQTVDRFVNTEIGSFILYKISQEIMKVYFFNQHNANVSETMAYLSEVRERLRFPSLVSTALTRFKKGKIEDFLADFYRKVGSPVINYMDEFEEEEKNLYFIPFILYQVTKLISEKDFLD